uniref:IBB domain-containing protein n=1 Tax=Parascaris equorum TaxID=6256 RepID=A0A914RRD8_PAREQ
MSESINAENHLALSYVKPPCRPVTMLHFEYLLKGNELRRRRAECSVELRKQKRESEMMKRRNVDLSEQFESEDSSNEQKLESFSKGERLGLSSAAVS